MAKKEVQEVAVSEPEAEEASAPDVVDVPIRHVVHPEFTRDLSEVNVKLRPVIEEFGKAQELKLRIKDPLFPDGWRSDSSHVLFERLIQKLNALDAELTDEASGKSDSEQQARIAEACVDIANFAMMVRDVTLGVRFGQ